MSDTPEETKPIPKTAPVKQAVQNMDPLIAALLKRLDHGSPAPRGIMVQHRQKIVQVTVRELRAACLHNPEHHFSKEKLASVVGFKDDAAVFVDEIDVRGIILNMPVDINEKVDPTTNEPYIEKKLRG